MLDIKSFEDVSVICTRCNPDPNYRAICNACEVSYEAIIEMRARGDIKDIYTCNKCGKSFYSKDVLMPDCKPNINYKVTNNIYFIDGTKLCWNCYIDSDLGAGYREWRKKYGHELEYDE